MAKFPEKKPVNDEPPPPKSTTGNLSKQPRVLDNKEKLPLQFKVTSDVFEDFSSRAHEEFGHKKGAKLELFLAMWEAYQKK